MNFLKTLNKYKFAIFMVLTAAGFIFFSFAVIQRPRMPLVMEGAVNLIGKPAIEDLGEDDKPEVVMTRIKKDNEKEKGFLYIFNCNYAAPEEGAEPEWKVRGQQWECLGTIRPNLSIVSIANKKYIIFNTILNNKSQINIVNYLFDSFLPNPYEMEEEVSGPIAAGQEIYFAGAKTIYAFTPDVDDAEKVNNSLNPVGRFETEEITAFAVGNVTGDLSNEIIILSGNSIYLYNLLLAGQIQNQAQLDINENIKDIFLYNINKETETLEIACLTDTGIYFIETDGAIIKSIVLPNEQIYTEPMFFDMNNDGTEEIIMCTPDIKAFDLDGNSLEGGFFQNFPIALGEIPTSISVADLDKNGTNEIICGAENGKIYLIYQIDGTWEQVEIDPGPFDWAAHTTIDSCWHVTGYGNANPTTGKITRTAGTGLNYDGSQEIERLVMEGKSNYGAQNIYWLNMEDQSSFNVSDKFIVTWQMKFKQYFVFYVNVETDFGIEYIYFTYYTDKDGKVVDRDYRRLDGTNGKDPHYHIRMGPEYQDGNWHRVTTDLQLQLLKSYPHKRIKKIYSYGVAGNGIICDVRFSPNSDKESFPLDLDTEINYDGNTTTRTKTKDGNITIETWTTDDNGKLIEYSIEYPANENKTFGSKSTNYYDPATGRTLEIKSETKDASGETIKTTSTEYAPDKEEVGSSIKSWTIKRYYPDSPIGQEEWTKYTNNATKLLEKQIVSYYRLNLVNGNFERGAYKYTMQYTYEYTNPDDPKYCTRQTETKLHLEKGKELEKTTWDLSQRKEGDKTITTKKAVIEYPAGTVYSNREYIITSSPEGYRYEYIYYDKNMNETARNIHNYDKTWKYIQLEYIYPSYRLVYDQYIYDIFHNQNLVKSFHVKTIRNEGEVDNDQHSRYDDKNNLKYSFVIYPEEDVASIAEYSYDKYNRQYKIYCIRNMPKEKALEALNTIDSGGEINLDEIKGPKYTQTRSNLINGSFSRYLTEYINAEGKPTSLVDNIYDYSPIGYQSRYQYITYDIKGRMNYRGTRYYDDEYGIAYKQTYEYFNIFMKAYLTYLYEYPDPKTTILTLFRGKHKVSKSIIKSVEFNDKLQATKSIQYIIYPENDKCTSAVETYYFYDQRNFNIRYVNIDCIALEPLLSSQDILDGAVPALEQKRIRETRKLAYNRWGTQTQHMYLLLPIEFLQDAMAGTADASNAISHFLYTYIYDDSNVREKNITQYGYKGVLFKYDDTLTFDKASQLQKEYTAKRILDDEIISTYKINYIYNEDNTLTLGYKTESDYTINDRINCNNVEYVYDENNVLEKSNTTASFKKKTGEEIITGKIEAVYKYDPETSYLIEQTNTYFVPSGNELLKTSKAVYTYPEKPGGTTKWSYKLYNAGDELKYTYIYGYNTDAIGNPTEYLSRYIYNTTPNYIYDYNSRYDELGKIININAIYRTADEKELRRGVYTNFKYENGNNTYYETNTVYPDGSIPFKSTRQLNYNIKGQKGLYSGNECHYFRNGNEYYMYKADYDLNGRYITDEAMYACGLMYKYSNYVYDDKINRYTSYTRYCGSSEDSLSRGEASSIYDDLGQYKSYKLIQYDNAGNLIYTSNSHYDPETGNYKGRTVRNEITGGNYTYTIKEKYGWLAKSTEIRKQNSPAEINIIENIFDTSWRLTGAHIKITDETGNQKAVIDQVRDPQKGYLTSVAKRFMDTDGATVKQTWTYSDIQYFNEYWIKTMSVDVQPDNYTIAVAQEYDAMMRQIANICEDSRGNKWKEVLDPVTGNILYIIDLNTGETTQPEEGAIPSGLGSDTEEGFSGGGGGAGGGGGTSKDPIVSIYSDTGAGDTQDTSKSSYIEEFDRIESFGEPESQDPAYAYNTPGGSYLPDGGYIPEGAYNGGVVIMPAAYSISGAGETGEERQPGDEETEPESVGRVRETGGGGEYEEGTVPAEPVEMVLPIEEMPMEEMHSEEFPVEPISEEYYEEYAPAREPGQILSIPMPKEKISEPLFIEPEEEVKPKYPDWLIRLVKWMLREGKKLVPDMPKFLKKISRTIDLYDLYFPPEDSLLCKEG